MPIGLTKVSMRQPWYPYRLSSQLLVFVGLTVSFSALLVGGLFTYTSVRYTRTVVTEQMVFLAKNVASVSGNFILTKDLAALDEVVRLNASFPYVKEILVVDANGRPLSEIVKSEQGLQRRFNPRIVPPRTADLVYEADGADAAESGNVASAGLRENLLPTKMTFELWHAVSAGNVIGAVRIRYSLEEMNLLIRAQWQRTILYSSIAALAALSLLVFFLRAPMRALAKTTSFATSLSRDLGSHLAVYDGTKELALLGEALNGLSTQLHKQEQVKAEFVANMSHELRTPLTSIYGSLMLLQKRFADLLPEKAATLLEMAQVNSQRLLALINDILDVEKITAGQMVLDLRPLDLVLTVQKALAENAGYASSFNVNLQAADFPASVMVAGDASKLAQVLANLLSNAVKFSAGAPQVEIRILLDKEMVRVEVQDHGQGIPVEFRSRIFSAFAQANNENTRNLAGTGLGLHICQSLITAMRGEIGFTSELGQGACFWFTLPRLTTLDGATKNTDSVGVAPSLQDAPDA